MVLFDSWFCVGRHRRPRPRPARPAGRARRRRRVDPGHQRTGAASSTRRTTSAGTGARRSCPSTRRPAPPTCAVGRPALPLPLLDLRPGRPAAQGTAHRGRRGLRPDGVRAAPGRGRHLGRLLLRPPHARDRAADFDDEIGEFGRSVSRATRSTRLVDRASLHLRRRRQLQGARRELQRVLPLRAGPPRAHPPGPVVRRRRRRARLGRRHPAPRRRVDLHDDRHHQPHARSRTSTRPSAAATRASCSTRTCGCRAQPTTSRRSRRGRSTPIAPGSSATCCSSPRRPRPTTSTRTTRATSGTWSTAGLGDLRVRAARDVVARLPAGLVRADGGPVRRHPPLAAAQAGGRVAHERSESAYDVRRRRPRRAGQRRRRTTWPRPGTRVLGLEQFELGHERGASHDTSRILRHSYHTPGYVRLTFAAYDDWATLEHDSGETLVTQVGGLDLFPPDAAIPIDDYTTSMAACEVDFETLDRLAIAGALAAVRAPGRHRRALPGAWLDRPGRARDGGDAGAGAPVRRRAARPLSGDRRVEPYDGGVTGRDRRRDVRCRSGRRVRRRLDQPGARPASTVELPLTVTLEQVTYFQPGRPDAVPARCAAAVDLDGRPVLLRLPDCYGEATVKAAARLQRDRGDRRRPAVRARPGAAQGTGRLHGHDVARLGSTGAVQDLPLHAAARPRLRARAGAGRRVGPRRARRRALRSSSPRRSAGCSPSSPTTGVCSADVAPFAPDRDALTKPDQPVHWLV